jgi:hypothetical protein
MGALNTSGIEYRDGVIRERAGGPTGLADLIDAVTQFYANEIPSS